MWFVVKMLRKYYEYNTSKKKNKKEGKQIWTTSSKMQLSSKTNEIVKWPYKNSICILVGYGFVERSNLVVTWDNINLKKKKKKSSGWWLLTNGRNEGNIWN